MRIKKLLFVLVAFALMIACIMPLGAAFAGTSSTQIGSMNSAEWSTNPDSKTATPVTWGNKDIKFTSETDQNATNITSQQLGRQPDAGARYYASVDATLTISSFANANSYFAIGFGYTDKKDTVGKDGSTEIYFKQGTGNQIAVGARKIGTGDIIAATENPGLITGRKFSVSIYIGAEGDDAKKLTVKITTISTEDDNHTPVSFDLTPVVLTAYPNGRIGFGQKDGKNIITITAISAIKYEYMNPENAEFVETFEPGDHANNAVGYNGNLLYTEAQAGAYSPSYLEVEKGEDGNSYLRFNNTGYAYFITRYEYSNWSLTFDFFDASTKRTYNENGVMVSTPLPKLYQAFGITDRDVTNKRAHSVGAQGGAHIGWVPTGKLSTGDWEQDDGKFVMLLTGGVYHYRHPIVNGGWTHNTIEGNDGLAHRNLADFTKTSMGANPNKYEGKMKVRFSLVDGIYRMWFNRADTLDAFLGTEAEFIAANLSDFNIAGGVDADVRGLKPDYKNSDPNDPTSPLIDNIDAVDYAARDVNGDGSVTEDDYWLISEPYMTADIGRTPQGRIMFGCEGSPTAGNEKETATGSFSIDNIAVKNEDNASSKKVLTSAQVGYKVNGWPQREETQYNYNDFYNDDDLLANKIESGATGGITLTELIIILVCAGIVVGVGVAAVIIILKNKPKAEVVEADEVVVEETNATEEATAETPNESNDSVEE